MEESLEDQLAQAQILLAFVLKQTGKMEITREALEKGLPDGAEVAMETDLERNLISVWLKNG